MKVLKWCNSDFPVIQKKRVNYLETWSRWQGYIQEILWIQILNIFYFFLQYFVDFLCCNIFFLHHFFTGLLVVVQGTLRDLSKGGRNAALDHMEPVCDINEALSFIWKCLSHCSRFTNRLFDRLGYCANGVHDFSTPISISYWLKSYIFIFVPHWFISIQVEESCMSVLYFLKIHIYSLLKCFCLHDYFVSFWKITFCLIGWFMESLYAVVPCWFMKNYITFAFLLILFPLTSMDLQETPMDVKPTIMEGEFSGIQDEHVLLFFIFYFFSLQCLSFC